MKVWLFYQKAGDLEPILYGYTANKLRSKEIEEVRNLPKIERVITREEYREWHDKHQKYEFIPFRLESSKMQSTIVLCTGFEIEHILFHGDEMVYEELSKYVLPPEIFSKEYQKILRKIGYFDIWRYREMKACGMHFAEEMLQEEEPPVTHIKVDQLGLFLHIYGHTFK